MFGHFTTLWVKYLTGLILETKFGNDPFKVYSHFRSISDSWFKTSDSVLLRATRGAIISLSLRIISEDVWRSRHTISVTNVKVGKGLAKRGRGTDKKAFPQRNRLQPSIWTQYKYLRKCWAFLESFINFLRHWKVV